MKTLLPGTATAALVLALVAQPAAAQSLRGSIHSVNKQHRTALEHDYTFLPTANRVHAFVAGGYLVRVPGNENYALANVSFPFARPEVKLFIERLSAQYRAACNERLVVTSLTRPKNSQPRNASDRSVHPTGMAIDLRRSNQPTCRAWLEDTLLSLERTGVVEATRERWPPHYHVAVFTQPYKRYVASLENRSLPQPSESIHYQVRRGDSLWRIARNYGVDVDSIKEVNRLAGTQIYAGQTLRIPTAP